MVIYRVEFIEKDQNYNTEFHYISFNGIGSKVLDSLTERRNKALPKHIYLYDKWRRAAVRCDWPEIPSSCVEVTMPPVGGTIIRIKRISIEE